MASTSTASTAQRHRLTVGRAPRLGRHQNLVFMHRAHSGGAGELHRLSEQPRGDGVLGHVVTTPQPGGPAGRGPL